MLLCYSLFSERDGEYSKLLNFICLVWIITALLSMSQLKYYLPWQIMQLCLFYTVWYECLNASLVSKYVFVFTPKYSQFNT